MSKKSHRTEIKPPTTVTRSHIGINPKTGEIEFENLPSTWVAFFKKAGIRKKDLSDKETRDKVFKLMASSHIVNDMQKEVNNNPSTARALRNSVRQQKKIPEGITLTPITPGFIQQQKKKEVDRTLNQCTSENSSSKKEIKDQPKSVTKQNYSKQKQSQPIQKPVSFETGKKKPEPKQTNTTTPVRGKVTIPKVFCGEEQQEKPLTFYEKMQLKEKEKPKTSNVTNNSTLVKQKQEQKKSDFSTKPTSAHTYSSYTSHSTQPVSYNTSHNVKETPKSSTVTKKENSLELKTSTTTQHKDDKINHTSSTRASQQPSFTKPKITPSQSNTSSRSQVSTSKPINFEQKQSNDVDMSKVFAEQRSQLKKTGPQRQTPSVTKSTPSTQFAPSSQSYSNPKSTTKTYTSYSSSTVPKPVHSTSSIQPTTKATSYKTGSVANSSPRTKLNTNSPFSSQTNEQQKEESKPIIKKEEPKPIIKKEEPKCDITEEIHTVPLPPSTVPSFVPPPPPLSEDAYTTQTTSPNSAPTVSFTDLIYAQSNNLKPTEIEERQKEEDEVITALRNILSDRRKDMNMEDNEEDSEDDWSDDW
ncbi:hypothetical protein ENUP19_0009G0047 [Entamoeba nuttalli]|uniref:CRIB domain-containing protein n=2 Tax=Entamoeba nuttalli TaxID=412467 RepID=K2GST2_ENTNP|nr:hypothetical protein ENU1_214960 [Entamoeba nuttalli P19]EKE36907.1 hypothetical protein ENU1_214960 [Entamoeba nuttalli P19]|eukprot:XP_008860772.1 hypothetical protein ENU1_214960 [Entamoeba nuttalli P19]